jgi:hypothetical protein
MESRHHGAVMKKLSTFKALNPSELAPEVIQLLLVFQLNFEQSVYILDARTKLQILHILNSLASYSPKKLKSLISWRIPLTASIFFLRCF